MEQAPFVVNSSTLVDKHIATVLVVDDTPENLTLMGALLRDHFMVKVANNGEKALKIALSGTPPDLVLLDIMMPGMDGYQVLKRIKALPETRDIPVIFLTALDSTRDEEMGLDAGAVDYITKPIRPSILMARVRTHLELKEARDLLGNQNETLELEIAKRIVPIIFTI